MADGIAKAGGGNPIGDVVHSDFRIQIQIIRRRLSGQIKSDTELYALLLAPLSLIGVPLQKVTPSPAIHVRYCSWDNLGVGSAIKNRKAARDHLWIADLQEILLESVLIDWKEVLEAAGLFDDVLDLWFCPEDEEASSGIVQLASLASLSSHLSKVASRQESRSTARHRISDNASRAMQQFVDHFDLLSIFRYICQGTSRYQQDLLWNTSCRQLLALPDRIANCFATNIPEGLELRQWQTRLGQELERQVSLGEHLELAALTLSRCLKGGWLKLDAFERREGMLFTLLKSTIWRIQNGVKDSTPVDDYGANWSAVVQNLTSAEQKVFLITITSAIDSIAFQGEAFNDLVTPKESKMPGAEGTQFMSAATQERSRAWAALLRLYIPALHGSEIVEGQQDAEEDDRLDLLEELLSSMILHSQGATDEGRSPAMARVLVMVLCNFDPEKQLIGRLLQNTIEAWSADARKASRQRQTYLTLVLLLLLGSLADKDKVACDTALSPSFLKGVTAHLEHLSPLIRRLGMLVAETVAQKSSRKLSFGRSVWDGRGEGREEARVLRTAMLAFSPHTQDGQLNWAGLLELFEKSRDRGHVQTSDREIEVILPRARPAPTSKRLPEKSAAKKMLIEDIDFDDDRALLSSPQEGTNTMQSLFNVSNAPHLNPLLNEVGSDNDTESSSDSDSSEDEEDMKQAANGPEEGKAFGMGIPNSKKKLKMPIYINELAPLLRTNERGSVRLGLRSAQGLIERKSGWGGEVHDNAINLALALIGLNNNFRISKFETRRLEALKSLVVASPERVAPCLAEQYFVNQYSVAQRTAMLNALAFAAQMLSSDEQARHAQLSDTERGLQTLARDLAQLAIARARTEGEAKVPEIRREQALLVNKAQSQTVPSRISSAATVQAPYLAIGRQFFIFPLINRFWAYLQDASLARRSHSIGGSGSSIIDIPFLMGAFLDTLAILCYFAQNDAHFRQEIVPEVLEFTLTCSAPFMAGIATLHGKEDASQDTPGGSRSTVIGAAASLVLVLLDASWQLDGGFSLTSRHAELFVELQQWAAAIFEATEGGSDRSSAHLERSARASAAVLLRLNEIRDRRRG